MLQTALYCSTKLSRVPPKEQVYESFRVQALGFLQVHLDILCYTFEQYLNTPLDNTLIGHYIVSRLWF